MSDWIWALIIGFVLDLLLGDPAWLYHPVCIIGKYIGWMEKKLRRRGGNLRKSAVFLAASTVLLTMAVVALILMLCGLLGRIPLLIAMALLDWMGIAITSMAKEARCVEKALGQGVAAGRIQVARIVGRDTQELSEEEIIKGNRRNSVGEHDGRRNFSPAVRCHRRSNPPVGIQSRQHVGFDGWILGREIPRHWLVERKVR